MFGAYMRPDAEPEDRVYEEVKSLDSFNSVVDVCLEDYNTMSKSKMNLVIFRWVLTFEKWRSQLYI